MFGHYEDIVLWTNNLYGAEFEALSALEAARNDATTLKLTTLSIMTFSITINKT